MKVFIAALDTETNTFAQVPTGAQAFAEGFVAHGDATRRPENYCSAQLYVWRRRAAALGWDIAESLCAYAEPGGITARPVYEAFRDEILADLRAARPDAVLLALHGAMVAEGYEDCEGDLLAAARAILGPGVPIGVELDLHCHLTAAMVAAADIIVTYKDYPHTDIPARAEEVFTLVADMVAGRIRPVMAVHDCRMRGLFRPTAQPLLGLVDRLAQQEGRDGILSLSLVHGFPWADVPEMGAKVIAIADGDAAQAAAVARQYGEAFFALRPALGSPCLTIAAALDAAIDVVRKNPGRPVVIADVADNPGGGAPGDATFCLDAVRARGLRGVAIGYVWDPMAVRFCHEAGHGARFVLRLGGKCGPASGAPADLAVEVMGLAAEVFQHFGAAPVSLGAAAWVRAEGIDIILCTTRTQTFHPEAMATLGLDPSSCDIIVVKSSQHFYAGFAPIAQAVLYATSPGALSEDWVALPCRRSGGHFWPKEDDPFG